MRFSNLILISATVAMLAAVSCASKPDVSALPKTTKERVAANLAVINYHQPDLDHCVRIAAHETRSGKGVAVFNFEIGAEGHILNIAFDGEKTTLNDPELLKCVQSTSKDWEFPKNPAEISSKIRFAYKIH